MNNKGQTSKFFILLFFLFSLSFLTVYSNPVDEKSQASEWLSMKNEKGFLENKGQMVDMKGDVIPSVFFKTEAPELNFWITENGITIQTLNLHKEPKPESDLSEAEKRGNKSTTKKSFYWERIDIELKNGTIKKENIVKEDAVHGHNNYFFPHCPDGVYDVKEYEKITIQDVYPNIDWVFYRKADGTLKYDFIIHPGADYTTIELLYKSKTPVNINELGELELYTQFGNVKENTPVSFYNGETILTQFKLNSQKNITINGDAGYETSIKFSLPDNFRSLLGQEGDGLLIIDPQLTWATFYGGNGVDGPMSIDTDNNGNLFIAGYLSSANFPVVSAGTYFDGVMDGGGDAFILKFDNAGTSLWATYYGGSSYDEYANSVAVDGLGNIFVAGATSSADFPLTGPSFQGINSGSKDAFILKFDNSGNRLWATYYGGSGDEDANSVAVDGSGNIFVVGYTNSADFPITGPSFQGINAGGYDAFILKFDNAGTRLWATYYGGSSDEFANAVAVDGSGNVFVVGMTNSVDFPVPGTPFQGINAGAYDAFILKFDNAGNYLWATYYGGGGDDYGYSTATDPSGNVFVVGATSSVNFPVQNIGTFFQGTTGGGLSDAFILKFDNVGNRLWATYYGGSLEEYSYYPSYDNIAIDACGTVYIGFETQLSAVTKKRSCDGGYLDNTFNQRRDQMLIRFSNTGSLLWATYIGGNVNDFRCPLALDKAGNLFVSGEWADLTLNNATYPLVNPGGTTYYDGTFNGSDDACIMKFTKQPLATVTNTTVAGCVCDGSASVAVIGSCKPLQYNWFDNNWALVATDSFALNLCSGNYIVEVKDTINCNIDTAYVVIASSTGGVINVSQNIGICPGSTYALPGGNVVGVSGVYIDTLLSASGCDSIITTTLAVGNPINTVGSQTICQGQSVNIHGLPQSVSGVYTHTFIAVGGCDSISNITLNVNSISTNTITVSSCNSYIHNAQAYNASGVYTQTLVNTNGCDSVLTIDLTINNTITTNTIISICQGQSVSIHSQPQTIAGVYTQTFVSATGCDSISNVTLSVNNISTNTITISSCSNYIHNAQVYNASGIYTQTLANVNGCDSVLTINLTINNAITTNTVISICQGQSASIHSAVQNAAGVYTQTFIAAGGCDSISNVTLNINNISTNTIAISSCSNYTHNAQVYNASGIYTQTLVNANGCDSLLTLDVTINTTINTSSSSTICAGQSISIHNVPQNTAGIYTQTFVSSNGCDSISTVTLNVNSISTNTISVSACNSYTHNAQVYNVSGVYTQTLLSASGCDSLLTIDLTINNSVTTNSAQNICAGQVATIHGVNQYVTGIYTQTFVLASGCDSISTVTLNVNNTSTNTIFVSSCNSYTHNFQQYNSSGVYTQTLSNTLGCDSLLTINLTINNSVTTDTIISICHGQSIQIHDIFRNISGVYSQTFTSSTGCDSVSNVTLNIHPPISVSFLINPNPAQIGNAIQFTDQSQGAVNWQWVFGDILNSASTDQHPTFIYSDSGYYQVQLIVYNQYGCADTAIQLLYIEPEFLFYTPNTFTPNGDNINDKFLPLGVGIDSEHYELYIFDRWGNEIFKSTSLADGWDGRANYGKDIAQIDTYVWVIRLRDVNGTSHKYTGSINLVR